MSIELPARFSFLLVFFVGRFYLRCCTEDDQSHCTFGLLLSSMSLSSSAAGETVADSARGAVQAAKLAAADPIKEDRRRQELVLQGWWRSSDDPQSRMSLDNFLALQAQDEASPAQEACGNELLALMKSSYPTMCLRELRHCRTVAQLSECLLSKTKVRSELALPMWLRNAAHAPNSCCSFVILLCFFSAKYQGLRGVAPKMAAM